MKTVSKIVKLDGMTFSLTDMDTEDQGILNVECCQGEGIVSFDLQSRQIDIVEFSDIAITPGQKQALTNLIQMDLNKNNHVTQ